MGCDIHCYMEFRHKGEKDWHHFGKRINPGRNYGLFGILAGVRGGSNPITEPRGIPEDAAYESFKDNSKFIHESGGDDWVTPEDAARYVERCGSKYIDRDGKHVRVTHPDWHTHSWLTTAEYQAAIDRACAAGCHRQYLTEYLAVLAALKSLEENAGESRLVFWFDN